jgi:hypothetical protein
LIRSFFIAVAAIATIAAMAGHRWHHTPAPPRAEGPRGPGRVTVPAQAARKAGIIQARVRVRLSPAELAAAARRCATWASEAGFANNGFQGGSLTTAVAVALAESGCDPAACYDENTGRACTRAGTRGGGDSVDRGAWQLNSRAWPHVSASCAYGGRCSARVAYRLVSAYGSYFGPWRAYTTDRFAHYLWAAQRAVSGLRRGTLASALLGSCAAHPADSQGARVRLANCGSGAASQQWATFGGTLRSGAGYCLSAGEAGAGPVRLRSCTGSQFQQWRRSSGSALYNPGAGLCLSDPGSSLRPGHGLTTGPCRRRPGTAWFRP